MSEAVVESNEPTPLEGDVQSPDRRERLFKTYQEAIDFLDWSRVRQASLNCGIDQFGNNVVQVIYIK